MGVSTDAILFFGAALPDPNEDPYIAYPWKVEDEDGEDTGDWEEVLAERGGIAYPRHLDAVEAFTPEQSDEYRAYRTRVRLHISSLGCEIGHHCSDECTLYYAAVTDRQFRASRGYPETVDPARMEVPPRDVEKLRRFLAALGYTAEQIDQMHIGWHLVSWWG